MTPLDRSRWEGCELCNNQAEEVPAQWMIVSGYNRNKGIYLVASSCHIMQYYDWKSYGKTWLAYRRKPEEGETWQQ